MTNKQIVKTITKQLAQQKRQQITEIVKNWKETKMTKEQLLRKTYDQVENMFWTGRISNEQWIWYKWKFGQTSMQLCREFKGKPEPEFK